MPRNFGRNEVKIVVRLLDIQSQKKNHLIWFFSRHSRTREDSSAMYVLSDVPLNPVMPLAKIVNKQLINNNNVNKCEIYS